MKYEQLLNFIGGSKKFGAKAGLIKPRKLMQLLGNPQDKLRFVHIAGTNGKGSTASFLSEILIDAGYKTGLFTSPFLYEFNERMRINGKNISDLALCDVMEKVKAAADRMESEGDEYPTEFELVTAAAFCYFEQEKCDIVVLEVGLGGRFDATNIIKTPLLSVITSLSLDHTQYLGNTIEEIAFEKCGIIKEGGATVCYGLQSPEAIRVIEKISKERNNKLVVCDMNDIEEPKISDSGNSFTFCGTKYHTSLCGEYQIYNAVTAITAAQELGISGLSITEKNIKTGLKQAKWSGRLELLHKNPRIFADGSHNPDGMRAFVASASLLADSKKAVCVVGMMKDKDCAAALSELSKGIKTAVFTTVDNQRAERAEELLKISKGMFDTAYAIPDNTEALKKAAELAGQDGTVFAVGSLYMINAIKNAKL